MGIFDKFLRKKSSRKQDNLSPEDYLFSLVEDIQRREATKGYTAMSFEERVFYCVWTLEAQVNNGGFDQFYFNCSGDIAREVPEAFRAIGASHTAKIVERANDVFGPDGPPVDQIVRQQIMSELGDLAIDKFEVLDGEFLEYHDNLSVLLATYMKRSGTGG